MLKKTFISAFLFLSVLSVYFGSYLPFEKAQLYITALKQLTGVRSVGEFKENFGRVFDFYSPVGQEEVAKYIGNDVLNTVYGVESSSAEIVAREVTSFAEPHMLKNDVRHLTLMGQWYYVMWGRFKNSNDLKRAEEYQLAAFEIGPKLPPVLYGLMDTYRAVGNKQKIQELGKYILSLWPDDAGTKKVLRDFS